MKKLILASILGLALSGSTVMADHCGCEKCKKTHKCDGAKGGKCDCEHCDHEGGSCQKPDSGKH